VSTLAYPPHPFIQGYQLEDMVLGSQVVKGPLTLPQSATSTLFTVSGGAILVTSLFGVVTTLTPATANNLSLGTVPSTGTAESAGIATATAINSLAAGTLINIPATPGSAGAVLVAPSVPLTGVAVTNNYHGSVAVTLAGGTLTGVTVNGVAVGSTPWSPATYTVPAHGTISWAGSVAPTWTWAPSTSLEVGPGGALGLGKEHVINPGTITWTTSASVTGAVKWYINYIPLDNRPGVGIGAGAVAAVA
jgi:hypothetical protein